MSRYSSSSEYEDYSSPSVATVSSLSGSDADPVNTDTAPLDTFNFLPPPSWSTPAASKSLQRELARCHAVQSLTSEIERGWVVDFDHITDLYQWQVRIVHLDKKLPLQKDLKESKKASYSRCALDRSIRKLLPTFGLSDHDFFSSATEEAATSQPEVRSV
ncbi:hypothetical protein HKX48_004742 [Thoreauomyces humboldtii]|nr:hypothetical protein HKX48_004742 [Thoreauomyces humboldtii]